MPVPPLTEIVIVVLSADVMFDGFGDIVTEGVIDPKDGATFTSPVPDVPL